MKKTVLLLAVLLAFISLQAPAQVMSRQADGTYVVNTTTLCRTRGYVGTTPLEVYIRKNRVVKVVALPNRESPKYFAKVKSQLLSAWNGKKVGKARKLEVDAVTGATFSSKAVMANVKAALEYYKMHK